MRSPARSSARLPASDDPTSRLSLRTVLLVGFSVAGIVDGTAASAQNSKASAPFGSIVNPAAAGKPAPAAPVSPEPVSTSASYGDWILRCQRIGDGDKAQRVCEVSQTIQVQNQRDPVAEMAIGRLAGDPTMRLTVALPPSVTFPSTVDVASQVQGGPVLQLQWRRCVPGGCFADAVPSDDTIKGWRNASGAGKLTFKDAAGRDISLPISFRGLAQALDALAKV